MYEEDEEVDAVEERYDVVEPAQRTPGETHDPITEGTGTGAEMGGSGGIIFSSSRAAPSADALPAMVRTEGCEGGRLGLRW